MWLTDPLQLSTALGLDLLFGDPDRWPHVARFTGRLSDRYEAILSRWMGRRVIAGTVHWGLVCGTLLAGYSLAYAVLYRFSSAGAWIWETLVLYQVIGVLDLHRHVRAVETPLLEGDLTTARSRLSKIVGRDTASLNAGEISRATIESLAESTHDSFGAPLFWYLLLGAPGALVYRAANTLDSMIGHPSERYSQFGKCAARVDDVLNWAPARVGAFVLWGLSPWVPWRRIVHEARQHNSPNAGWPEAAMANSLNVRLGGLRYYDHQPVDGPKFCPEGREPVVTDIAQALRLMWVLFALLSGVTILIIVIYTLL